MRPASRTRVKICGITRPEDALAAAEAGVDAIGLVFHAPSPRAVTAPDAARIVAGLPPFVTVTGLFVNAPVADVEAVLAEVPLDLLQFHGDETADYCKAFGRPWIKAIRVRPDAYTGDVLAAMQAYDGARGILLDAWHEQVYGGSGQAFDWSLIADGRLPTEQGVILAGGLNPANVAEAIRSVGPWAVDVSSGVEEAPGRKSGALIEAFMQSVHACRTAA